jgi:hypothetical protein
MTATAKAKFPRARISRAVSAVIPKGHAFTLHVADSEIGKKKIVRVVTPAWKKLRGWERIGKVLDAVNRELTSEEQEGILRFSVLTPDEYEQVVVGNSPRGSEKPLAAKKLIARRKTVRQVKRGVAK